MIVKLKVNYINKQTCKTTVATKAQKKLRQSVFIGKFELISYIKKICYFT